MHDVAVAIERDGAERVVRLPTSDNVAPPGRTEGYATRFDLACDAKRLVVVDPTHATLWDLASASPRQVWTAPLSARRMPVTVTGDQLAITCHAARIDADTVVVEGDGPPMRLGLTDGMPRPGPAARSALRPRAIHRHHGEEPRSDCTAKSL